MNHKIDQYFENITFKSIELIREIQIKLQVIFQKTKFQNINSQINNLQDFILLFMIELTL